MTSRVEIFGIRHHGPGSARSLERALALLEPDAVLGEGPPDAEEILPLAAHVDMSPPVALLVYEHDDPTRASFYPFAEFSPEWCAIRHALGRNVPLRFMDLPCAHRSAVARSAAEQDPGEDEQGESVPAEPDVALQDDPLSYLARAAGYGDGERWWDEVVESRREATDVFQAVREAMTALRQELPARGDHIEELREAWMRKTLRAAVREGFERIAVVCGAWHVPALATLPPAKQDTELLAGLPKVKVQSTWVPWSYGRLSFASGYGAGVASPGWYEHLWTASSGVAERWLTRVARLLREEDLDASSAHIIEAVRLAEALAALRGRPVPGLDELGEATRTVLCFGNTAPMQVIADRLIVGERLGAVPSSAPATPLLKDLEREQKRVRLKPSAESKLLDLDLRRELDRDRSRLIHRLRLLGIPWGEQATGGRSKGTFHEVWRLAWDPAFAVALVDAGRLGNDIADAATAATWQAAMRSNGLPELTKLLDAALLADLPFAVGRVSRLLESRAALTGHVQQLMDALPPLANVLRYGNVRQTDSSLVEHLIRTIVPRVCIGLPGACSSLDDDAASAMLGSINAVDAALTLNANEDHLASWRGVLRQLTEQEELHGLIAGRACRLLMDAALLQAEEVASRLALALSRASDTGAAAAWIDGLLRGSGLVLVHDEGLWSVLDAWLTELSPERFVEALPLIRRTFSTFEAPERRQMGERVRRGTRSTSVRSDHRDHAFDVESGDAALKVVALLLGLGGSRS